VARAALMYLHNQAEAGSSCPLTMTYASVPALRLQPDLAERWLPKILAREYDPRNVPSWFIFCRRANTITTTRQAACFGMGLRRRASCSTGW